MDQSCKNCQNPLTPKHKYCDQCGAKVVEGRLTVRNLLSDVVESYLNFDNNFIKTFLMMFAKPHLVIDGYIQGIRRKFKNPVSYLAIALTLSGLILFVIKNLPDGIPEGLYGSDVNPQLTEKITPILLEYSSFFFILYIPIFAFAGYLTFNRKAYNFLEYNVVMLYALGHYSIVTFPIALTLLLISPEIYWGSAFYTIGIMIGYTVFCMQMLNRFKIPALILRSGVFLILSVLGYFGIIILFYVVMFITGTLTLEDFKPVEQAYYATSSCINWA